MRTRLTAENLEIYLICKDWEEKITSSEIIRIWTQSTDQGENKMLVPNDQTCADYRDRLLEVVFTLGQIEKRSPFDIYAEIAMLPIKKMVIYEAKKHSFKIQEATQNNSTISCEDTKIEMFKQVANYSIGVLNTCNLILEEGFGEKPVR